MRRGTTPTLTFTLPVDSSIIERLFITFSQKRGIMLEKNIDDCEFIDGALQVTLSQKETLSFNVGAIDIQIRLKTNDGSAMASNIVVAEIRDCLKDGEI